MLRLGSVVSLFLLLHTGLGLSGVAQAAAPRVVESNPVDGATGVPVDIGRILVDFDRNMEMNLYSVLRVPGADFPPLLQNGSFWESPTRYVMPIAVLQPETRYALRLNSATKKGFQGADDQVPLPPTVIRFTTGPAGTSAGGAGGLSGNSPGNTAVQQMPPMNPPLGTAQGQFQAPEPGSWNGTGQMVPGGDMPYPNQGAVDSAMSPLVGTWLVRTNEFEILAILNADGTFQRWLRTLQGTEYTQGNYEAGNGVLIVYPYDDEPTLFNFRMPDLNTLEVTDENGDGVRMVRQGASPLGAAPPAGGGHMDAAA